jgi:squalene-hopene/tetraprenyl-beta-curcumene cyclase
VEAKDPALAQAAAWLEAVRNPDGGWGEDKRTWATNRYERGPSAAATTAPVVEALITVGREGSQAVFDGLAWLLAHQDPDGSWQDPGWNGVMVPGRLYLRYHLIPTCVAVGALVRALDAVDASDARGTRGVGEAGHAGTR